MPPKTAGAFLVGLASILWATDALFRFPTVKSIDATFIVWAEHAIALLALLIWVILKKGKTIFRMKPIEWVAAFLIGAGGSAIATILFTSAFRYLNPSVVILLQKLQPVLVVILAIFFLGEKPHKRFYLWAAAAFASALVLTFPDLNFGYVFDHLDLRSIGVAFALGAALLWAVSTIAAKVLLRYATPGVATFWRYVFGFLTLGVILGFSGEWPQTEAVMRPEIYQALLYMGLVPGLIAMATYYQGLIRTSASTATFMELLFPVAAVTLNAWILDLPLEAAQVIAAACLLVSVTMISIQGPPTQR